MTCHSVDVNQFQMRRRNLRFLEDDGLMVLSKNPDKAQPQFPPKVRGKHFSNLDLFLNSNFRWLSPKSELSPKFNRDSDLSYFEQTFMPCKKLGEGSFASVIEVMSKENNEYYAMKITKEPFKGVFDRKNKLREVENHHSLSGHPNIVKLYSAWEEDRLIFMQLELCKPSIVEDALMCESDCWEVLCDILQALDCVHDSGNGHFDVKVENILKGQDNLYKLSDFGLMASLVTKDEEIHKEGDSKYVALELLSGKASEFTAKADIFSLGISLLEIAGNLELPSRGEVWRALRNNIIPYKQTEHLSDEFLNILLKMMSKNPHDRPSAKELLALPKIQAIIEKRRKVNVVRLPSPMQILPENSEVTTAELLTFDEHVNDNILGSSAKRICSERVETQPTSSTSTPTPPHPDEASTSSSDSSTECKSGHCSAKSLHKFGISPFRMCNSCKGQYMIKRAARRLIKRNLMSSFTEDENEET